MKKRYIPIKQTNQTGARANDIDKTFKILLKKHQRKTGGENPERGVKIANGFVQATLESIVQPVIVSIDRHGGERAIK